MIVCDRCPEHRTANFTVQVKANHARAEDEGAVIHLCHTCYQPWAVLAQFYVQEAAEVGGMMFDALADGSRRRSVELLSITTPEELANR